MFDPRMKKLADLLVNYSCAVKPGDHVLIDTSDVPAEMVCLIIDSISKAGGLPFAENHITSVSRAIYMNASAEQMQVYCQRDLDFMKQMQCYIGVRGAHNIAEMSDVPEEKTNIVREYHQQPVQDWRVDNTRWVVLRWPTPSMAQLAGMSTEQFENFFFDVCTLDYARMAEAEKPLAERMMRTDIVRIYGPLDTDITFSIKDMPAVPCAGERNIPDGEVFTAPLKYSVNGVIHFNTGTIENGKLYDNIRLCCKDGKIVEASASDTESLNKELDCDEGARYIGEFSLGFNPHIKCAMRDILFDEKIAGSLHFTPGRAYEEADNGNRSKLHWDLVLIQTPEYGGGEIWFDDELIRKDGRFVPDYLQGLNPENLI